MKATSKPSIPAPTGNVNSASMARPSIMTNVLKAVFAVVVAVVILGCIGMFLNRSMRWDFGVGPITSSIMTTAAPVSNPTPMVIKKTLIPPPGPKLAQKIHR